MSYTVHVERTVPLPPAQAFAALADHNRLGDLLGGPVKRIRDGEDDVNGVGSVRRILKGPLAFEETVTRFEPGQVIEYRITRGSPLRNHQGRLDFAASGDEATQVTWHVEFDSAVPLLGGLISKVLNKLFSGGLEKLGRS